MTQLAPTQVPVAEGLFTWPSDEPALIASQTDGKLEFPSRPGGAEYLLKRSGRLWAFTTQSFRPPSPPYDGNDDASTFVPYVLGYVELDGELLVEARLVDCEVTSLKIGDPMQLRIVPYTTRPDGVEVLTFAFAPTSSATSGVQR
jgi:uncharacterized OB-fold protein